jgi:hypothetical protein
MKKSLIALAAAAVLASGAASADSFSLRVDSEAARGFVAVQDYGSRHWDADRRWDDDRRLSIDERQARIDARIREQRQRGALTRYEARQLRDDLASIEAKERRFLYDGHLDGRERADLHRDLDRLAWNLRGQARDDERRY